MEPKVGRPDEGIRSPGCFTPPVNTFVAPFGRFAHSGRPLSVLPGLDEFQHVPHWRGGPTPMAAAGWAHSTPWRW